MDIIQTGLHRVAALGARPNVLSILIFHRVARRGDPLAADVPSANEFDWQMRLLAKNFNVLSLSEANRLRLAGRLPPRAAVITFDDGYADNAEVALPILQRHGLTASFFIATDFMNGGCMWNDIVIETVRRMRSDVPAELWGLLDVNGSAYQPPALDTLPQRAAVLPEILQRFKYLPIDERQNRVQRFAELAEVEIPRNLMMSTGQLRELHNAGMELGAHTCSHPILATLDEAAMRQQIGDSKQWLESTLQKPVTSFAYPNGRPERDYNSISRAVVEQLGFEVAVSTAVGVSRQTCDALQLPRFTPWDKTPSRYLARLLKNTYKPSFETVTA